MLSTTALANPEGPALPPVDDDVQWIPDPVSDTPIARTLTSPLHEAGIKRKWEVAHHDSLWLSSDSEGEAPPSRE